MSLVEFNLKAKPKATVPVPPPDGGLNVAIGKKYYRRDGALTIIEEKHAYGGYFRGRTQQEIVAGSLGVWYLSDGKCSGFTHLPDFKWHLVSEVEEILNIDQAMTKHMQGVHLMYRSVKLPDSKWMMFPPKSTGGIFANPDKMKQMYGNSLQFKVA